MKYKQALPHPIESQEPKPKVPTLMELSEIIYRETGCPHDYASEAARKIMESFAVAYKEGKGK